MEDYNEGKHTPKMLPCLHTVCATCLSDLATPGKERSQEGGREEGGMGRGRSSEEGSRQVYVTGEPIIRRGQVIICPLCRGDVLTERMQTNR